ncbi:hypothetical protein [Agrobacterium rosae]|uniref:hypothetical protein n=1 Tax=Agrobacterium rosae TaxID=1972867 RepID=UPI003BA3B5C9
MILKLSLRSVLSAFAIAMVAINLFAMIPPAAASAHECNASRSDTHTAHHHDSTTQSACCDSMHCCPVLPGLPSPETPSAACFRPHAYLKSEQPLLLVTVIDPPPRSSAS